MDVYVPVLCADGSAMVEQAKIGPPETHVHETQRYCVYEGGNHLVLELSTVALDVPYGDHFSVECRFDVTQVQVGDGLLNH